MKDTIMKLLLLTGCAGFPGTMLRYTCVRAPEHVSGGFPWGTLPVNAIGAFAAGFLFVYCRERFAAYQEYFPIVFPGFPGAFTTFSTYTPESVRLFEMPAMPHVPQICSCKTGRGFLRAVAEYLPPRN